MNLEDKEVIPQPIGDEELENASGGVDGSPSSWKYCRTCGKFLQLAYDTNECPDCGSQLVNPTIYP